MLGSGDKEATKDDTRERISLSCLNARELTKWIHERDVVQRLNVIDNAFQKGETRDIVGATES